MRRGDSTSSARQWMLIPSLPHDPSRKLPPEPPHAETEQSPPQQGHRQDGIPQHIEPDSLEQNAIGHIREVPERRQRHDGIDSNGSVTLRVSPKPASRSAGSPKAARLTVWFRPFT